ncbi:MAG TPA: HAD hydrolase-like protein [Candidatus Binataceae bacterium]|nr:HAD hydrolase-like protein [Candidatus Binataceae bacterium]
MIDLVMFDADGVLFDSDASNVAYYNAICALAGEPPLDRDEEIRAISYSTEQVLTLRARDDAALLVRMKEIARTLDPAPFFKLLRPPFALRPFMLEMRLRFRLGLATNRSATVPALLEYLELGGIFDAVASARDPVRPKPAPDILRLCVERAGTTPERAVYAGDSPIDRVAARAAGVHFIAVGPRVEHERNITALEELPAALARLEVALTAP